MKITLPSSKNDYRSLSSMTNILTNLTVFLGKKIKKIPGPLVKALKVTQDEYEMEKR